MQHNLQSAFSKMKETSQLLNMRNIDIAILCETWEVPNGIPLNFGRNFNVVSNPRPDGYGGVAIACHTSIVFEVLDNSAFRHIEVIGVRILNFSRVLHIFSVYIPPRPPYSFHDIKTDLENLFHVASRFGNSLVCGDLNAHNKNFYSHKTDRRGELIEQLMFDFDFRLMNENNATVIPKQPDQHSVIDLSFLTLDISGLFSWEILDDSVGSDHKIIYMNSKSIHNTFNAPTRKVRLLDHSRFQRAWHQYEYYADMNADQFYEKHDAVMAECMKIKTVPFDKFKPKPWWKKEVAATYAKVRQKLREVNRIITPQNLNELKEAQKDFRNAVKRVSNKSAQDFAESLKPGESMRKVYRKVKCFFGEDKNIKKVTGEPDGEILNDFLQSNAIQTFQRYPKFTHIERPFCFYDRDLELVEVANALKRKQLKKTCPGPDDLTYQMLDLIPINLLFSVMNHAWSSLSIPPQWLTMILKPILKQGKNPMDSKSYRPIAMASCFGKTFSSIVKDRLETYFLNFGIIPDYSFGFRQGYSTKDAALVLFEFIKQAQSEGDIVVAAFLDVSKAYDNVNIDILHDQMLEANLPNHLTKVVHNLFSEKVFKIAGKEKISNKGLAQGDPCSPLLFNFYTRGIHRVEKQDYSITIQYADDFTVLARAKTLIKVNERISRACQAVMDELQNLELSVNPEKCVVMPFHKDEATRLDLMARINVNINSTSLRVVSEYKFLGLFLDSALNFSKHVIELKRNLDMRSRIFGIFGSNKRASHPKILLILNKTLMVATSDYLSEIYSNTSQSILSKLTIVQNRCLRFCLGALRSTPIKSLEAEANTQPICIRSRRAMLKTAVRILSNKSHPLFKLYHSLAHDDFHRPSQPTRMRRIIIEHREMLRHLFDSAYQTRFETLSITSRNSLSFPSVTVSEVPWLIGSKKNLPEKILRTLILRMTDEVYGNHYKIYSDASKQGDDVGYGVHDPIRNHSFGHKLPNYMSIHTAELFAIFAALRYIKDLETNGAVVIFTDSKVACAKINNPVQSRNSFIVKMILAILDKLPSVSIQWIPGHVGVSGNEKADEIAKICALSPPMLKVKLSITDADRLIAKVMKNEWEERYKSHEPEKGLKLQRIEPRIPNEPFFWKRQLNRQQIVTLVRLRTGHLWTNEYKHRFEMNDTDSCEECGSLESIAHVIFDCKRYEVIRQRFPSLLNVSDPESYVNLLKEDKLDIIAKFVAEAQPTI